MQATKEYDLIVIGAGSGGMGCGRRASQLGKKVAMIENRVIGGTCVNVGCVPKKVMLNLASFMEEAHLFKDYGVNGTEHLKLDFKHFKAQRDGYVKKLNGIYESNLKKDNVDYYTGTASFQDKNHVKTSEGAILRADSILIASGSQPPKAMFPGSEHCWSSDNIFTMEVLPKSLITIGGGYIGIEMSQIMVALGVKTTILVRSTMLRGVVDKELMPILQENMTKLGLDYRLNAAHEKVEKLDNGMFRVTLKDGSTLDAEQVLSAIGRPPCVDDLGLENAGVTVNKGAVVVDEFQNTNVEGIYAIGDVTNKINLTPVAIREGRILSERLYNGKVGLKMNHNNVATVIFSHPPIGSVGFSEDDAVAKWGADKVKVYRSQFVNMFYSPALTNDKKLQSLFKTITHIEDDGTERVVGCYGIGKGIDEMMQGISIAVTMGATKQDFDNSVAIHPTASEEWVLMDAKFIQ
jgi:glutathione reductase (NADPH)